MVSILIVEDEENLNNIINQYLELEGYKAYQAFDGKEGLNIYKNNRIDIVISDIMMPNMDGYMLAKEIRLKDEKIPIIFMSAKDDKPSKHIGYKIGIDDYITKPFDIDELVFKINALARRLSTSNTNNLEIGNFKMDLDEHIALVNNTEINLSRREFDILFNMLSYPKKVFTRSSLMEVFWDFDSSATSRTVDVYLSKLREKTKDCDGFEIKTVHGLGYKVVLKWKKELPYIWVLHIL